LARGASRRYSADVPRPARLLLAALAVVAWSAPPRAARADEPAPHPAPVHAHHRTRHGHRAHHDRRARLEEPSARAPRDGSDPHDAHGVTLVGFHPGKHPPAEKAESLGSPNEGHLKGGVHLDVSHPYLHVVPAYESGDVRWGLPALVNMIDRAARAVNKRFPGSALDVGDLSQHGGGDVSRHHSHESGRDADLGFYVIDAKGKQIHARTFIKFDTAMASPTVPGARYDTARNWAFVQELITDPTARISHLFIAEWVRRELLAYAKPRVSHAMWERAALALMQPRDSLPHDDHIHLRISCPHELHSSCIELASRSPHGHARVAHKGAHPMGRGLKTPGHLPQGHPAGKPPAASAVTPQDVPLVIEPATDDGESDVVD
jgi:penicillin-insensitive murein endopeptidase